MFIFQKNMSGSYTTRVHCFIKYKCDKPTLMLSDIKTRDARAKLHQKICDLCRGQKLYEDDDVKNTIPKYRHWDVNKLDRGELLKFEKRFLN